MICPVPVGVTATRQGATVAQLDRAIEFLSEWPPPELHHGDCLGGDADLDAVAVALGIPRVVHPPTNAALRAFCVGEVILSPETYKVRNQRIVLATGVLLAFPAIAEEQKFGGTWGTVRYARSRGRPVIVVLPDGSLRAERTHGRYFGH